MTKYITFCYHDPPSPRTPGLTNIDMPDCSLYFHYHPLISKHQQSFVTMMGSALASGTNLQLLTAHRTQKCAFLQRKSWFNKRK